MRLWRQKKKKRYLKSPKRKARVSVQTAHVFVQSAPGCLLSLLVLFGFYRFHLLLVLMFRPSLRSFRDPLREHVCSSCLAARSQGSLRLYYQFSTTTASGPGHGADDAPAGPPRPSEPSQAVPTPVPRVRIVPLHLDFSPACVTRQTSFTIPERY